MDEPSPSRSTSVSPTGYAVLGLLSFGRELSGYDLKKWADHSLSLFFWSPAMSQIYGELRRLETLGLVSAREVPQDDLRNKRVYRLTDAGDEELRRWLHDSPVDVPVLKHPAMLRLWLGHMMEGEQLRSVLAEHMGRTEERVAAIRRDLAGGDAGELGYSQLILRWAERHYDNERANTEQLLAELDELALRLSAR